MASNKFPVDDLVERLAKTLHQIYGPAEIQAWDDKNFDHEPWYFNARLVLRVISTNGK